jgi:hypothetical protein
VAPQNVLQSLIDHSTGRTKGLQVRGGLLKIAMLIWHRKPERESKSGQTKVALARLLQIAFYLNSL